MSNNLIDVRGILNKDLPMYISNRIIEAHFTLPIGEQRLIYAYISKLSEDHVEFPELEIYVKEFTEMLEMVDPNYHLIKNYCKELLKRVIEIESDEEWVGFQWFSVCRYKSKEGKLKLKIHDELKPYLLQLKKEFTRLVTKQVMKFRSVYSVRIYMLCKQYQAMGRRLISVEELRKKLGIPNEEYKKYNDFKKRVIEQAKKEINSFSDIEITYDEIKQVRKVVEILFYINHNIKSEIVQEGLENFTTKSMAELASMFYTEVKKRWNFEFPLTELQHYKKSTLLELIMTIIRGVYDEKKIEKPYVYFKAALDNIESGNSIY